MGFSTSFKTLLPRLGLLATLGLAAVSADAQTAPTWASVQRFTSGANGLSSTQSVKIAADGSRLLSGPFEGTLTIGSTTLTAGVGDSHWFVAKFNPNGTLAWANVLNEDSGDSDLKMATDAAGNVYLGGYFSTRLTYGSSVTLNSPANSTNGYVIKIDPQGTPIWSKTTGVSTGQEAYLAGVATDAAGNVYLTGDFIGTVNFGAGAATQLTSTSTTSDIFIYKFTSAGVPVWSRRAGGAQDDYNFDLTADAAGNTYLTGSIGGAATFGTVTLSSTVVEEDSYVAKFDTQGAAQWAQRLSTPGRDEGNHVVVDASGSAVVGGYAETANGAAAYVARFGPQGGPIWQRIISPSQDEFYQANGVAYDGRGGIYLVSTFVGTLTLGSTTLTANDESSFIVRYDEQGNPVWASSVTSTSTAGALFTGVQADAAGNIFVPGFALGAVTFGNVASSGNTAAPEAFVARLNAGGILNTRLSKATALSLAAYPNPAAERTTLELPAGGGKLTVVDALGRTVREQALPRVAGPCEVLLAGLRPGIYQLHAALGNGQTGVARLTVR